MKTKTLKTFDVVITDKDGLWGSLRLKARTKTNAFKLAREYIGEMSRRGDTSADIASLKTQLDDCPF